LAFALASRIWRSLLSTARRAKFTAHSALVMPSGRFLACLGFFGGAPMTEVQHVKLHALASATKSPN
jgi:hypothetical protein